MKIILIIVLAAAVIGFSAWFELHGKPQQLPEDGTDSSDQT